jgi:hypothetical protein
MSNETRRETFEDAVTPGISDVLASPGAVFAAVLKVLSSQRLQPWLAFASLGILNVLFRLPHFINANGASSDTTIVGLQAMHMLRGEIDRFLWGVAYQGSFDAMVVAAFFAAFGPTSLALMLAPFLGHLILCACVYAVLLQRLKAPWTAALLCLPLVFSPLAINGVALYAPRQWCVTLLFIGFWLFEGGERRRPLRFFAGAFVACLATFLDLFAWVLLVPMLFGLMLCAFDAQPGARAVATRLGAGVAGTWLGIEFVQWLRGAPASAEPHTGLLVTLDQANRNWSLFYDTCLPWVLGAKIPGHDLDGLTGALQKIAGGSLLLFIGLAPFFVFSRDIGWRVKRLGVLGAVGAGAALGGFLVSTMPVDQFSARYLAPVVWFAPLALAPWAAWSPRRSLVLITPYLVAAAIGGWQSHATYVEGVLPRVDPRGTAVEEMRLADELRARGIKLAFADYWLAYRLTFLWSENPVVVPFDWQWDRHPEYLQQLSGERTRVYLFHPSDPQVQPDVIRRKLKRSRLKSEDIEGFTVLTQRR